MAIWKKKSGEEYIDLSEKMRKQQSRINSFKSNSETVPEIQPEQTNEETSSPQNSGGGFFGSFFGGRSTPEPIQNEDSEEKKKKLAKRLMDMTQRIEDLENQIFKLNQRLEITEKKQKLGY